MTVPIEVLDDELDMLVLKGIPDLMREGTERDIILRRQQKLVYQEAIKETDEGLRVCLTGNPGIGKTCTGPFLLRSLLEKDACKVVYYMNGDKVYYIFTSTEDGKYTAEIRHATTSPPEDDPALFSEKNAYIVDTYSSYVYWWQL